MCTLLPYTAYWLWILECDDTPWYPSMRLFRQEKRKEWASVLERVAAELADRVQGARNNGGNT